MTGYGKAEIHFNGKKIHAEIKSLNSKNLDLSARIAPIYREKEMEVRKFIAAQLERGKVDFNLWVEKDQASSFLPINQEAVKDYTRQIRAISESNNIPFPEQGIWEVLIKLPETMQPNVVEDLTEEEWNAASQAVAEAVGHLVEFRTQEGLALQKKFSEKIDNIERLLGEIEPFEKSRVEKIRQRLTERLEELKGVDYDKNRLEQELIYYIEKLDISEEKTKTCQPSEIFPRNNGNQPRTRQEIRIHRPRNGKGNQHNGLEEQSGRDAEHRCENERRVGTNQRTGS